MIALMFVDVATRYTFTSKIANGESDTARTGALIISVKHYRLPEQITSDSGGESSANRFADSCADTEVRRVPKPRGSHTFLAESRIYAAKAAPTRL